ncbi:MAG TPA: aminotransferase class I/II-fold pyridoxal phosphate-dependent enzyme [Thermohalobaculum sp.]|nr:aminotransferase class I/II-fold pyridoxal phosphate-dependent enzyme [Thermohalobaculum sp.]
MTHLARRDWVPAACEAYVQRIAGEAAAADTGTLAVRIRALIERNRAIHERECVNLNPATNVMNRRAEAALAAGLGTRPSLGYPGDKYEMGLEAIERIEVIAAELAAEVFDARFAEVRVPSGAMANLYAFMACSRPGDAVIVPPATLGGHVTHHEAGAAGLYGLRIHAAPVADDGYTVDVAGLARLADAVRPALITLGGSLNLAPHPVAEVRAVADAAGARLLFDAAHLCGMIAGGAWPNPLAEGADLMSMSTYKSLGGPAGGLLVTNDPGLAERLDRIAFPGLTANFDAGRVAALALALLDWRAHGPAYAAEMVATAAALAAALEAEGLPVFRAAGVATRSHQFALEAARWGGGQRMAKHLRRGNILTCGIGLPLPPVAGDMNGLRLGTPEIVRRGMTARHMGELAGLIARALGPEPEALAGEVSAFRQRFTQLRFVG